LSRPANPSTEIENIMVKPIGNLTYNLKPKDKVRAKTQARFSPTVAGVPPVSKAEPTEAEQAAEKAKPFRFNNKKRKR